jgi:hypothetical protein
MDMHRARRIGKKSKAAGVSFRSWVRDAWTHHRELFDHGDATGKLAKIVGFAPVKPGKKAQARK